MTTLSYKTLYTLSKYCLYVIYMVLMYNHNFEEKNQVGFKESQ